MTNEQREMTAEEVRKWLAIGSIAFTGAPRCGFLPTSKRCQGQGPWDPWTILTLGLRFARRAAGRSAGGTIFCKQL